MRNINLHRGLFLAVFVGVMLYVAGLQAKNKIIVGCDNNYPPYEFANNKGEADGFNVDIVKAVAEELSIEVEFRVGSWSSIRSDFDKLRIDLLSGMFYNSERAKYYDFSVPHSLVSFSVFTRDGEKTIESLEELKGKMILVQKDDIAYEYLMSKQLSVVGVDSPKEALLSLSSGNYDCAFISRMVGLYYKKILKISNVSPSSEIMLSQRYCFAVKHGNFDLISQFNETFLFLKDKEKFQKIQDKWFGAIENKSFKWQDWVMPAVYILAPIGFLLLMLALWTQSLRKQVRKSVANLEKELMERQKAERLHKALYRISESAVASDNIDQMYSNIHSIVNELVPAKNFYIALYDQARDLIEFPYFVDEFDSSPVSKKTGRGLTEFVIFSGKPLLCSPDIFISMIEDGLIDSIGAPSVDWLGAPLKIEDKPIGALVVQSYTDGVRFTKSDEEILLFVSSQIAMAIERKHAEQEILALNSDLEERVVERTYQLEETLEELRFENSERKRTQEALEKAQLELEHTLEHEKEVNEMKSRFISIVSHEYRTPLTVILSSTYLIEKFYELQNKDEFLKHLKNIQASVQSMTKLLDDVLTIGKTEAGTINVTPSDVNLNSLAKSIMDDIKLTDKHNHVFELSCSSESIIINTDLNLLNKILINILSNAVKYSAAETNVKISILEAPKFVDIKISDQGIGIPEAERDMLFNSYHRFKNVGAISGTGLGLSIVKRFADLIGANISVASEVGKGATFTVRLQKRLIM
jgi:signal transduction histidine kinase/ABC-type amino acid transport substrate-binding protein